MIVADLKGVVTPLVGVRTQCHFGRKECEARHNATENVSPIKAEMIS